VLGKVLQRVFARAPRPALSRETDASAAALVDRGNALAAAGDHAGAIGCYDRALAQDPASAVARSNRALSLTAVGRIREAWADGEARFELSEKTRRFLGAAPLPAWRGEPLPSGRLLVLWEQALGDIVQHVRFLPLARERVAAITFYCRPELVALVAASFPDVEVLPADGAQPAWERYAAFAPLNSLPRVLQLDWPTLPARPYLLPHDPEPAAVESRVGIVWRSSAFDPARDCPLEDMIAALGSNTAAVSLQFGTTPEERAALAARGIAEAVGSDFLETARRMRTLAAIVTVDTSAAHVAAALGRPTLLLLNEPAAVRWMLGRPDSPWYPTMRILRKPARDGWRTLAPAAAAALRSMTAPAPAPALKLNLGSGPNPLPGYVNVDLYGTPDVRWNLEETPWPWDDDSVGEIRMSHVLEHLGQSPQVFIGVMKELYRVCRNGARVYIRVPHPRHDFFLTDPTHVRPILPGTLDMFSLRRNLEWETQGVSTTPLGKYHGIDFELEDTQFALDEPYATELKERRITQAEAVEAAQRYGNVVTEIKMTLRAVKPFAGE
jgi:tetratricopeptide (TPR) repeat protein